jgi:coenzyme F420-reducing hydrogenase gamma subunit
MDCKIQGNVCVMVARGTPCLGPVTHTGCGALCPTYDRGCYGCFGAKETPNAPSLSVRMAHLGMSERNLHLIYRTFNANDPRFREEADRHAP